LTALVKVLRPTRHKIGHFGDVLLSQSLGLVLKKLDLRQWSNIERQAFRRTCTSRNNHVHAVHRKLEIFNRPPTRYPRRPKSCGTG